MKEGRAIAQAVTRRLSTAVARFDPRSSHVGFVVDNVALGHVFFEYFGFPANSHSTDCSPHSSSIIRGWYTRPVSGRRTKWT
jgi:hypothetical protein